MLPEIAMELELVVVFRVFLKILAHSLTKSSRFITVQRLLNILSDHIHNQQETRYYMVTMANMVHAIRQCVYSALLV